MNYIDKHLQYIQEDTIQEMDPITISVLAFGSLMVITNLVMLFLSSASLIRSTKVNKPLSEKVNKILNSGNKWIVHNYATKDPNAFALGFGRHIFITSGLLKILDNDEIEAILLHEIYHNEKKHTPKNLAYKYPLYYLIAFIGTTVIAANTFILAFIAMYIATNIGDIVFRITAARKMEYNADSYAAKQGYGRQLISAFKKIEQWAKTKIKVKKCDRVCQVVGKIDKAIDEHPEAQKRIENILRHTNELEKAIRSKSFKKIKAFVTKTWGK